MPPWTSSLQMTSRFLTHQLWDTQWYIFIWCVYIHMHIHINMYICIYTDIGIHTYTYVMKGNGSHVHGGWEAPPCAVCTLRPEGGARQFGLKAWEPAERKVWTLAGGRRGWTSLSASVSRSNGAQHLLSSRGPSWLDAAHSQRAGPRAFLSPPVQMLISSGNTLTHTQSPV